MIPFIDIHTHHIPEGNPQHIVSIVSVDPDATPLNPELRYSIGIHPYNIENKDFQVVISESEKKQVLAIGECGIDHRVPITARRKCTCVKVRWWQTGRVTSVI